MSCVEVKEVSPDRVSHYSDRFHHVSCTHLTTFEFRSISNTLSMVFVKTILGRLNKKLYNMNKVQIRAATIQSKPSWKEHGKANILFLGYMVG